MDGAVLIRPARAEERGLLEDLQRSASLALDDYREALLAHPDAIALTAGEIAAGRVHVTEVRGRVVGFMVLMPKHAGELELDGLFVDPATWRNGVGQALIAKAREIGECERVRAISMVANPTAQDFYAACGFELTGSAPTRFGPALTMRLKL